MRQSDKSEGAGRVQGVGRERPKADGGSVTWSVTWTWSVPSERDAALVHPPGAQRRRSGAQRRTFTPFALPPSLYLW